MTLHNNFSPIIADIQKRYLAYRSAGKSRKEAISAIESSYMTELQDEDDRVAVMIGLTLSLCQKKELTKEIKEKTLHAIHCARRNCIQDDNINCYFSKIEQLLEDSSFMGDEALFRRRTPYTPDWKIGDIFSHTLTCPMAEKLGISGWLILLYKVGEYVDELQHHRQLMYVSLCSPGKEPVTHLQLQELGFLRVMNHDDKWDYLVQITFKSKKDQSSYGLRKIGNIPSVALPADRTDENPLVVMPLFGYLKKGDQWPSYEDQICRLYRKYGKKQ